MVGFFNLHIRTLLLRYFSASVIVSANAADNHLDLALIVSARELHDAAVRTDLDGFEALKVLSAQFDNHACFPGLSDREHQ